MGNLQRQIGVIKQQLALSTAETVARLKKVDTDVANLKGSVTHLQESVAQLQQSVADLQDSVGGLQGSVGGLQGSVGGLKEALEDQGTVQQAALDQLLDLVVEEQGDLSAWKANVEERLNRLEQKEPPAA